MLNLKELIVGDVNRLRYVFRHNGALTVHRENVAEHSYYVAMYSMMIGYQAIGRGYEINTAYLLEKALLHDIEECRTGDILRPFKRSTPELFAAIEEAAAVEVYDIGLSLTGSKEGGADIRKLWEYARDHTTFEGRIVDFADFLAVLSYLIQEMNASNHLLLKTHQSMKSYAATFNISEFDFIRDLVREAQEIAYNVLGHKELQVKFL